MNSPELYILGDGGWGSGRAGDVWEVLAAEEALSRSAKGKAGTHIAAFAVVDLQGGHLLPLCSLEASGIQHWMKTDTSWRDTVTHMIKHICLFALILWVFSLGYSSLRVFESWTWWAEKCDFKMEVNTTLEPVANSSSGGSGTAAIVSAFAYIVPTIFALICMIGLTGNGLLIFIILRNRIMRTTPNILIGSLALSDVLLLLASVPFFSLSYTLSSWSLGTFLCKVSGFLKALSLGVSIFTLTALSIDRYMAIMHPMKHYTDSPTKRTAFVAIGIWVLAAAFAMVEGTIIHVSDRSYGPNDRVVICHSHPDEWGEWFRCFRASLRFVVYFAIPVTIIGVLYLMMARSLLKSSLELGSSVGSSQGVGAARQAETRRKVAILVLSIVVLFIICWLPRHIFLLWMQCPSYGEFNMFWFFWKIISYCLCFTNSCVNPVALYFLSQQFRKYFKRYLCCEYCRGSKEKPTPRKNQWLIAKSDDSTSLGTECKTMTSLMWRHFRRGVTKRQGKVKSYGSQDYHFVCQVETCVWLYRLPLLLPLLSLLFPPNDFSQN